MPPDYNIIAESLTTYWDNTLEIPQRIFGCHHHALIGIFSTWWLIQGKEFGYNPVLLTGEHAGREPGQKGGGRVADTLFCIRTDDKYAVVGLLEAESGAQATFKNMVPRTDKCIESIIAHKKDKKYSSELQWAILFGPRLKYLWQAKKGAEENRLNKLKSSLQKVASDYQLIIFDCLSGQQFDGGARKQMKWDSLSVTTIHPQ